MPRDFGLAQFKASPLGRKVEPILLARVGEMRDLARSGEAPAKAVDAALAHLVPEGLHQQRNNSHVGRWIYELIGMEEFVSNGFEPFYGQTFDKPSTFIETNEPTIRRTHPRPGGDEFPIRGKNGFQLARGDLDSELKNHAEYAVYVHRLSEAVHLIRSGYSIRMGRRGVRPSLISPEGLEIIEPVGTAIKGR